MFPVRYTPYFSRTTNSKAASTLRRVNWKTAFFFNLSASKDLRPHGKTDKKIRLNKRLNTPLRIHSNSPRFSRHLCASSCSLCCFVCLHSRDSSIVLTECRRKGERRTLKLTIRVNQITFHGVTVKCSYFLM